MTFRVLVADALSEEGLEILRQSKSAQTDVKVGLKPQELAEILPSYDGLIVRSATQVDAGIIAAGKALKIIGRAGIGVDNIDVRAATRAGVVVMNTPEGNATTTAEHTLALMFSMARKVPQADASMKAGKWDKKAFMGRELRGLTLGVVGLGNIGRLVAERAQALKMRVVALPSGVFITTTPARVAARTSMLSTPIPARPMILSALPAAIMPASTWVALRTMRPS